MVFLEVSPTDSTFLGFKKNSKSKKSPFFYSFSGRRKRCKGCRVESGFVSGLFFIGAGGVGLILWSIFKRRNSTQLEYESVLQDV